MNKAVFSSAQREGVSMKRRLVLFFFIASVTACGAQSITISGTVKNSGGSSIDGALVRLGKAHLSTTTGTDGSFKLTGNLTGVKHHAGPRDLQSTSPFRLYGNKLYITAGEQADVKVKVYDCNGRLLTSLGKAVSTKDHAFALPSSAIGMYIFRISINNASYTVKSIIGGAAANGRGSSWNMTAPAMQTTAAAPIDDALLFSKAGYQLYRLPIKKSDTSGIQATLTALVTGTVTDAEGNSYQTVQYGKQVWTIENFRSTKYNDGSSIGSGCAFYNNTTDAAAKKKWGALYSGSAATSGKLAPTGWRIPTNADWDELQKYLIENGYNYDGTTDSNKIAQSMCATTDWQKCEWYGAPGNDPGKNNASGFSALPGGVHDFSGTYFDQNTLGWWWTSTTKDASFTYARTMMYTSFDLYKSDRVPSNGFSIRIVKSN
jgi:uncharacterized protein (TIGR02145 family)